jgi:hypothetical protein
VLSALAVMLPAGRVCAVRCPRRASSLPSTLCYHSVRHHSVISTDQELIWCAHVPLRLCMSQRSLYHSLRHLQPDRLDPTSRRCKPSMPFCGKSLGYHAQSGRKRDRKSLAHVGSLFWIPPVAGERKAQQTLRSWQGGLLHKSCNNSC